MGVVSYYDTHSQLKSIERQISNIKSSLMHTLVTIDENIRRLFHK